MTCKMSGQKMYLRVLTSEDIKVDKNNFIIRGPICLESN